MAQMTPSTQPQITTQTPMSNFERSHTPKSVNPAIGSATLRPSCVSQTNKDKSLTLSPTQNFKTTIIYFQNAN